MNRFQRELLEKTYYHYTGENEQELLEELTKVKKKTEKCNAIQYLNPPLGKIRVNKKYFSKHWIAKRDSFYGWHILIL